MLLCTGPTLVLAASLGFGLLGPNRGLHWSVVLAGVALALGGLNLYLSWRLTRTRPGERHVSGIPLFGTFLVLPAATVGFGSVPGAVLGLAATLIDTGGALWFLLSTWRDGSLWDE